jgi:hypothetical protein
MKLRCMALLLIVAPAVGQTYRVTGSIPLGGSGAWDYLQADTEARRLYVSRSNEVIVLDLDTQEEVGRLRAACFCAQRLSELFICQVNFWTGKSA